MSSTPQTSTKKANLGAGMRIIFKYLSQYKTEIRYLIFFTLALALTTAVIPFITGKIFDSLVSGGGNASLLIGSWFIVQVINQISTERVNTRKNILGMTLNATYVNNAAAHMLRMPLSFHKTNKVSSIMSRVTASASALDSITREVIIDVSPQILSVILALIITFSIKPLLAYIMLFGAVVYVIVNLRNNTPTIMLQRISRDSYKYAYGQSSDSIDNIQTVKQFVTEDFEIKKNTKNFIDLALGNQIKIPTTYSKISRFNRVIILLTQLAIFITSVYLIHKGQFTVGQLIMFTSYATLLFNPFNAMSSQWRTFQNGIVNLEETEEILQLPEEQLAPKHAKTPTYEGVVEFKHVNFSFEHGRDVLKDIDFSVKKGQKIAFVGESGVGKSTTIDLISGYYFPTVGDVLIDGIPTRELNLKTLRQNIAVVPQEVALFNDTIMNNIRYGNFQSTDEEVKEAARKAHAFDFIEKFPEQWNQLVGERGMKLSVGQKQRVAIARAILKNPKILILDEPTSALDAGSEAIIVKSLEELMKGRTTFIVAHRLSTVRKANKILVFKDGSIIESGKHLELLKIPDGEYKRLYKLQIGLHK